jgi:nucleoside-diphosphate-sugar epimerase
LAAKGPWESEIHDGDVLVVLHAQITSTRTEMFEQNNVLATQRLVEVAKARGARFLVHVSSSVLHSRVVDDYVRTKRKQEEIIRSSGIAHCVLRPTLMYGWFDPKHLGWLARFMEKAPIFPIPGDGRFIRQPLYAQDFSKVIEWCIDERPDGSIFDLTGPDHVTYVEMIKAIRQTKGIRRLLVHIPVPLFRVLLQAYATISRNPPFTRDQLDSLAAEDDFYGVDLKEVFGVEPTGFASGIRATLTDERYGGILVGDPEDGREPNTNVLRRSPRDR